MFCFLQISSPNRCVSLNKFLHFNIILSSNPGSPNYSLSFKFLHQILVQTLNIFPHINIIFPSTPGTLSVLFPSDFFIKALYRTNQIPTLILSSNQSLGPLSVLLTSDFFIKTLYTFRPNPHFNIILPSIPEPAKCSLSFRFLHQNTLHT